MTAPSLTLHVVLALGAVLAATIAGRAHADAPAKAALEAVAQRRIFFGHQSVGMNLVEGLQELARREGVKLRVAEAPRAGVEAGTFAHAFMEENGDPMRKLRSFAQAFSSGAAARAEIAFLKFCYVDVTAATDVTALFAAYRKTLSEVQAANPGTTFLHVTVPLQTVEGGLRGWAKRMLGRPLWGTNHNARREEFNELLRREYQGKAPFFDLARVEATRPDGETESAPLDGRDVRALVPAYTDDGGHLNALGRLRAARELAAAIAAAPPGAEKAAAR